MEAATITTGPVRNLTTNKSILVLLPSLSPFKKNCIFFYISMYFFYFSTKKYVVFYI